MPRRRSRRRFNRKYSSSALLLILMLVLLVLVIGNRLGNLNLPRLPDTGDIPEIVVPSLVVPTLDFDLSTLQAGAETLVPELLGRTPTPPASSSSGQGAAACVPDDTPVESGAVTRVVDGDTIQVEIDGSAYTVRYIGIDTPESTNQVEYFGKEAAEKNGQLVAGRPVQLVKDVSETDRFGRLLRYVFVDDTFVNWELVAQGYATAVTFPPDVACADAFRAAEQAAAQAGVGLWAEEAP